MSSAGGLTRALRNVRSVIVLGKLGALPQAAQKAGVERLVLLSTAGEAANFNTPAVAATASGGSSGMVG
jgi:hypothetical protein